MTEGIGRRLVVVQRDGPDASDLDGPIRAALGESLGAVWRETSTGLELVPDPEPRPNPLRVAYRAAVARLPRVGQEASLATLTRDRVLAYPRHYARARERQEVPPPPPALLDGIASRLLQDLSDADLDRLLADRALALTEPSRPGERPLPEKLHGDVRRLVSSLRTVLPETPPADLGPYPYLWEPVTALRAGGEVTAVAAWLRLSPDGTLTALIHAFDATGTRVAAGSSSLRLTASNPDPGHPILAATKGLVAPFSEASRLLIASLPDGPLPSPDDFTIGGVPDGDWTPPSEDGWVDPLATLPTDALLALAEALEVDLVAALPDRAFGWAWKARRPDGVDVEAFLNAALRDGYEVRTDNGFLIAGPISPHAPEAANFDREAWREALARFAGSGVIDLRTVCRLQYGAPTLIRANPVAMAWISLAFQGGAKWRAGWLTESMQRLLGSLTDAEWRGLYDGGSLTIAKGSARWALAERIGWRIAGEPGSDADRWFARPLARSATERFTLHVTGEPAFSSAESAPHGFWYDPLRMAGVGYAQVRAGHSPSFPEALPWPITLGDAQKLTFTLASAAGPGYAEEVKLPPATRILVHSWGELPARHREALERSLEALRAEAPTPTTDRPGVRP